MVVVVVAVVVVVVNTTFISSSTTMSTNHVCFAFAPQLCVGWCVAPYIHVYIHVRYHAMIPTNKSGCILSNAPKGNAIGAKGS